MNYIEEIRNFVPGCEQEEKDRALMLAAWKTYGDAILERSCELFHLTASSMIFNRERTMVLMAYHNIFQSWAWTGGHADGEPNRLETALKEASEETGIQTIRPLQKELAAVDILEVRRHIKRGKFVNAHLHFNLTYLCEADETEALQVCEGENSQVGWLPIEQLRQQVSEAHMLPVYEKLIRRGLTL